MSQQLPPVPPGRGPEIVDGTDWLDELSGGWYMVPYWGREGWDLMQWPHAAAAHYDGEDVHALATYVEGDVRVETFPTREERDARTDRIATVYWRATEQGPQDLPESDLDLAPHHRGPYPEWMASVERRRP